MQFSLILATVGRTEPLVRLFNSLTTQTHRDFKLIVVDQNIDDRLAHFLARYGATFPIIHLRSENKGKSSANNVGLLYADGDVIHFPDDDCWYPDDLFERVNRLFTINPNWGGVTGREATGKWDRQAGFVNRFNLWRRHISFTMFFRRQVIDGMRFDETLGVGAGTKWGSGEDSDFLLRAMQRAPVYYDPDLTVFHPEWAAPPYEEAKKAKARNYGMGMGHVLRVHSYPSWFAGYHVFRPLAGALLSLLCGDPAKAQFHWAFLEGRSKGWLQTNACDVKVPEASITGVTI